MAKKQMNIVLSRVYQCCKPTAPRVGSHQPRSRHGDDPGRGLTYPFSPRLRAGASPVGGRSSCIARDPDTLRSVLRWTRAPHSGHCPWVTPD